MIDDLDNADSQTVASQYGAMSDTVAYAEPNYQIKLDDPIQKEVLHEGVYYSPTADHPNDPQFGDQWALNNLGQDNGRGRADTDALRAWTKTKGSQDVVVAVLDSGVDFTHVDLRENMWIRPESVPAYWVRRFARRGNMLNISSIRVLIRALSRTRYMPRSRFS